MEMQMSKGGLTPKQFEMYQAIDSFIDKNGYSPSYKELAKATGKANSSTAFHIIKRLERRGYVASIPGSGRSLIIIKKIADR